MALPRRRILRESIAVLSLAAASGCTTRRGRRSTVVETDSPAATATNSPTPTVAASTRPETETRTAAEKIMLGISNESPAEAVVDFSITSDGATISEGEVGVPAGEYRSVDTGIRDTGEYELTVESDGGVRSSYTFDVGEYNIRTGSNLILTVYDERTELMMEE